MGLKARVGASGARIGYKRGGVGASVSMSSDGIQIGGGIGVLDVDFNFRDGTGRVGWGFGLYEMRVSRDGCSYIKDFYVGGIYTHTEYQRDPKCDDDLPDRDKDGNKKKDEERDFISDEEFNTPAIELDPERFPPNSLIFAEIKWRNIFVSKANSSPNYTSAIHEGWMGVPFDNHKWPDLFLKIDDLKYSPDGWVYNTSVTYQYSGGDGESFGGYQEDSSNPDPNTPDDTQWVEYPIAPVNVRFGFVFPTPAITERSSIPLLYFGAYSLLFAQIQANTFPDFILSVSVENEHGEIITIERDDAYTYEVIGINFYDENGLVPPRKLTPPPPPPPMDCCDKLDKRLKRIEKTINTDLFIDENGVKIPKNLFIPGGRGDVKITNYADYLGTIIRIQAQSGIFPFSIEKKDINLVQSGNQSQTYYLPTATEAVKAILENTIDNETKNDAILNLSVRIGIMVSKIVGKITFIEKTVQAISDFLGYPRREKIVRERIEVDPTLGARKQVGFRGFGPAPRNTNRKIEKQIELIRKKLEEGDKSLESALEDFLQPDDVAVRYEDFDDESGAPDLMELIDKGR